LHSKNPIYIALFLFLLSFQLVGYGQVQVKLLSDTNAIRIGEQVNLSIVVSLPKGKTNEITWPIVADTLTDHIEVVKVLPVDTIEKEALNIFSQNWAITSFDSGFQEVPSFELVVDGEEYTTDPFLLHVETMQVDTTKAIMPIKDVEEVPISWLDWIKYHWEWFAGLGVLAILVFGIYLILKNKRKVLDVPIRKAKPAIPAPDYAIKRLEELEKKKMWQQGGVKEYHALISEILREYLENQFNFPALEQTTAEVMRSVRFTDIDKAQLAHLQRTLMLSDLVKFAKEKPLGEENKEILALAYEFVNATKPAQLTEKEVEKEENEA